ncbi:MAG: M28 family peptidase [Chitinophagales bacterium]
MTPNIDRLKKDLTFICEVQPARNYRNVTSLNTVAAYIYSEFEAAGGRVEMQEFEVDRRIYKNVIASFGREEAERIVVGAHYDAYEDTAGADGNASGVVGILEMARLLGQVKSELKYRVDFVAYSLKEAPYYETENMGSAIHAKFLFEEKAKVKAMICCEMIGYFSDAADSQYFPDTVLESIYPNKGNFVMVVGLEEQYDFLQSVYRAVDKSSPNLEVEFIFFPSDASFGGMSDHRNYWKHGYDAVMITDTAFFRNPHYHKVTDTMNTLNFGKMAEVLKGILGYLLSL